MALTEEQVIELVAFLITSARLLETEPEDYGQMRLMIAAARLSEFAAGHVQPDLGAVLKQFAEEIPPWQRERLRDRKAYLGFIDLCSRELAQFLEARSAHA